MATKKTPGKPSEAGILKELKAIKRLLIVLLLKAGASQGEIALALGMSQAKLSKMIPARKFKQFGGC